MKYLSYYFSILSLCACLGLSNTVQAQQKIAHVKADELLSLMPEYKQAKSEVETYSKALQGLLLDQQNAIETYYNEVSQKMSAGGMSPLEQKEAEAKLAKMQADLQEEAGKADQKLADKEQALTKPIFEKFNGALDKVAKANGFAYILDIKVALYSGGGTDATELVRKELGM